MKEVSHKSKKTGNTIANTTTKINNSTQYITQRHESKKNPNKHVGQLGVSQTGKYFLIVRGDHRK